MSDNHHHQRPPHLQATVPKAKATGRKGIGFGVPSPGTLVHAASIGATLSQPTMMPMIVKEPSHHDILMGRGGRNNRHPGNKNLRTLTRLFADEYNACPRMDKPSIHIKIIQRINQMRPPGRFLEYNKAVSAWVVVDVARAREKVSQHLRDAVKRSMTSDITSHDETEMQDQPLMINPQMKAYYNQTIALHNPRFKEHNKFTQMIPQQRAPLPQNPLQFNNIVKSQMQMQAYHTQIAPLPPAPHPQIPLSIFSATHINPPAIQQIQNVEKKATQTNWSSSSSSRKRGEDPPIESEKSFTHLKDEQQEGGAQESCHDEQNPLLQVNKLNKPPPAQQSTSFDDELNPHRSHGKDSTSSTPGFDRSSSYLAALPLLSLRDGSYRNNTEERGLEPNGINEGRRRGLEPHGIDP